MSLTFPTMNNLATVPITNNNTLITLSLSTTITATGIPSASDMVSINPAPAIPVAAIRKDLNFETKLNAMENVIFILGTTFISANNLLVSHKAKMIEDI